MYRGNVSHSRDTFCLGKLFYLCAFLLAVGFNFLQHRIRLLLSNDVLALQQVDQLHHIGLCRPERRSQKHPHQQTAQNKYNNPLPTSNHFSSPLSCFFL